MIRARLFATAFVLLSAVAFAQQQSGSVTPPTKSSDKGPTVQARTEPGTLTTDPSKLSGTNNPLDQMRIDEFKIDPNASNLHVQDMIALNENGTGDDVTCLTIRSYLVARDSKDSDSTHLVGYSTCQPASRYRLRTTEMKTTSSR